MRKASRAIRRSRTRVRRAGRNRLSLERLEARELLATYTVIDTNDDTNMGSLRWAITQVDNDSSPDIIKFAIPDTGVQTIKLGSPLPQITKTVFIYGESQPNYASSPLIAIDGSSLSAADVVLWDSAASSTINGLAIGGCPGTGILLTGGGGSLIEGCYVGTIDGTDPDPNGSGIDIFGSSGNTIGGGFGSYYSNVISGNTNQGIAIGDAIETDNNVVEGNGIGVTADGSTGLGNGSGGILLDHASHSTISGNVISGNTGDGILIQQMSGPSSANLITDNHIGTDSGGSTAIPNTLNGIHLTAATGTTITHDLLSGNGGSGIVLDVGTQGTLIQSNTIGTDATGKVHLANTMNGIDAESSSGITIGGASSGQGNLISANTQNGIYLAAGSGDPDDTGVLIQGNTIGLSMNGMVPLANGDNGIWQNGSDGTTIGGTTALERNIISGNSADGISLGTGNDALVEGNYIGTDATGKVALGNGVGLVFTGASYATIGGTIKGAGNLISGNNASGIDCFVIGSTAELFEGNLVGVDATGVVALPNKTSGIRIAGPTNCTIGGTIAAAANVISGNGGDGVNLVPNAASGLLILGNFIGTDSAAGNLGNKGDGVDIGSDGVTIGGTASGTGNVIADNGISGILIDGNFDHNSFLTNSIYGNANLGINLGNGPTLNHPDEQGFTLPAPNDYQNYPILTSASSTVGSTEVMGTLNAAANTTYLIQFFANSSADPSGYGQGQLYLGSAMVKTGADSDANIDAIFGTVVPNAWLVSATATDPLGNTSEFSSDITPTPSADVGVTITTSPTTTAYAGSPLTYTVTVTQAGPDNAQGVTVVDTLPQNIGLNVTAVTSVTGVTPTFSGNTVTAIFGQVIADNSPTLTITVYPTIAAIPHITDQATVTSQGTDDPNPNNNTASVTTPVDPSADLSLSLGASANTVNVGDTLTYTLTANNAGPSTAADVVVTDALPLNITSTITAITSITGVMPTIESGEVTADLGSLAAGASATVTITVVPDASAVPQIVDSAAISSSTYDPDESNNAPDPVETTVNPAPTSNLSIRLTGSPNTVSAGARLTYTIKASNTGASTDPDVVVTDTLPADVTFVSATGGVMPSGGVLTLPIGSLASNVTTTLTIVVTPTAAAASGNGLITNSAVITGQYNINTMNSASVTTTVTPATAIAIQVTPMPATAGVGQNLIYTVTATNNGPSNATNVVLVDALPSFIGGSVTATTSVAGVNTVVAGSQVTASFGEVDDNDSVTLTITVVPTLAAAANSPLVDTATVTNNEFNPDPNTATSSVPVNPVSNLSIAMYGSTASVGVGSNLTYTIVASNSDPSTDPAAVVTDTLPANVTFVSATGGAMLSDGVLTLPVGSLDANPTTILTIVVTPDAAAAGSGSASITNVAVINSPYNTNLENSASVNTTVTAVTALGVKISPNSGPNYVEHDLTYTIMATNSGPSNATGVILTDTLPGDIGTKVTATTSVAGVNATVAGSQVTASFGEIDAGDSVTLTIKVVPTLAAAADSPLFDSAKVMNNEFNSSPNTASVATTILPIVAVAITQFTATPGPVVYGSNLTYKAVVTNSGPSTATGVVVTLPLPAFTSFVRGNWNVQTGGPASNGSASLLENKVTAKIGELGSGTTAVVTIVVTPGQDAVGLLTASTSISENEFNSTASAATAMVTTTVQDQPGDLQFTAPGYTVDNNAGYATITILRTSGLGGEVSAIFTTFSLSAAAGSDYMPVSETVDFPADVARETVRVPVLDNPYDSQDETVGLKLTNPTGGALFGAPTTSVLTIHVLNPNKNDPTVAAVQWTGTAQSITSLVISFSEPLIAAAATNPANYHVAGVGKKGSFSTALGQNVTLGRPCITRQTGP